MRRTDEARIHGGSRLDGNELIHEALVNAAAKLAEGLGQDKVGLRRIALGVSEATGIHAGTVGPHAMAAILIGGPQCMLESCQGEQDADGHGPSTPWGLCRKPGGATRRDGADQRRPGQGVRPLADGMHAGYKIGDLPGGSGTAQPMLEIMHKAHRWLSYGKGEREPQHTTGRSVSQVPMSVGKN